MPKPNAVKDAGEMEILTRGVKVLPSSNAGEHAVTPKMRTAYIPAARSGRLPPEGPPCAQGAP